jgi:hypothetical protein
VRQQEKDDKMSDEESQFGGGSVQEAPRPHVELGPSFAAPGPETKDLSRAIAAALKRAAGERVTCRQISGSHYRCNWWAARDTGDYDNPSMTGQMVTTHRVVRSELIRATRAGEDLRIDVVPRR